MAIIQLNQIAVAYFRWSTLHFTVFLSLLFSQLRPMSIVTYYHNWTADVPHGREKVFSLPISVLSKVVKQKNQSKCPHPL